MPDRDPALQNSSRRTHDLLRAGIRNNVITRDAQLSEHLLTRGYSTSRNAVREALQLLALEGLVTRVPRYGTRVTGSIVVMPLGDLGPEGIVGSPSDRPTETGLEELDLQLVPATPVIQERLQITDETVLLVEHLLTVDGLPLYARVAYLPAGPSLVELTEAIRAVYQPSDANDGGGPKLFDIGGAGFPPPVAAGPGAARPARLLQIAPGAPILVRERMLYDPEDRPLELSFTHLRGDRAALTTSITGP
jgi:GntR family transcriptional regulator